MMFKKILRTRTVLAILAGGMAGSLLHAADAPPTAPPGTPGGEARRPAPGTPGGPMRPVMLDEQQRQLMRQAMQKHSDEFAKIEEKMRDVQKEFAKAVLAPKQDEKVIREAAEAMSKVQAEQSILRAKIFAVVVPTLKPEQKEQIENSPWVLTMMLGGGPPPMRPMGSGPGSPVVPGPGAGGPGSR